MGCINRMSWLFPGYLDFTTTAPVIPKLYWDVESQEQRWARICEQLGKVICYSDCLGKQLNVTMKDVEDLKSEFEEFKESGFFDYYADDLRPFFERRDWGFLFDYDMAIFEKMLELVAPSCLPQKGEEPRNFNSPLPFWGGEGGGAPYWQVYQARHGFLPDLSILDLLCCMGPEAILYL